MEINFNTSSLTLDEARGIVALLLATHGDGVVPAGQKLTVEIDGAPMAEAVQEILARHANETQAEPIDPAAAFGAPVVDAPPATTPSTPSVDSAGLPWDERIHSSSRALNADGTWRARRGIGNDEKARVEAELKGVSPIPPAPAPADPVAPPPPSSIAPAAPTPPPAPPVSPPAAQPEIPPFPAFMTRMSALQQQGKITLADIIAQLPAVGLTALPDLASNPQHIPTVEMLVMAKVDA